MPFTVELTKRESSGSIFCNGDSRVFALERYIFATNLALDEENTLCQFL